MDPVRKSSVCTVAFGSHNLKEMTFIGCRLAWALAPTPHVNVDQRILA